MRGLDYKYRKKLEKSIEGARTVTKKKKKGIFQNSEGKKKKTIEVLKNFFIKIFF